MKVAVRLMEECKARGISLRSGEEGTLRVSPPPERLPHDLCEALRRHKAEILIVLARQSSARPAPYINDQDELIIPFESDPRYHWWKPGGQSLAATLAELNASPEIWGRYTKVPYGLVQ